MSVLSFPMCSFQGTDILNTKSGIRLLSHTVSSTVPSAARVLTIVFGMGTGVPPARIDTRYPLSFQGFFPRALRFLYARLTLNAR